MRGHSGSERDRPTRQRETGDPTGTAGPRPSAGLRPIIALQGAAGNAAVSGLIATSGRVAPTGGFIVQRQSQRPESRLEQHLRRSYRGRQALEIASRLRIFWLFRPGEGGELIPPNYVSVGRDQELHEQGRVFVHEVHHAEQETMFRRHSLWGPENVLDRASYIDRKLREEARATVREVEYAHDDFFRQSAHTTRQALIDAARRLQRASRGSHKTWSYLSGFLAEIRGSSTRSSSMSELFRVGRSGAFLALFDAMQRGLIGPHSGGTYADHYRQAWEAANTRQPVPPGAPPRHLAPPRRSR